MKDKHGLTLAEKADIENTVARDAQNVATIAYIAMMTDVDIEEDEEDAQQDV